MASSLAGAYSLGGPDAIGRQLYDKLLSGAAVELTVSSFVSGSPFALRCSAPSKPQVLCVLRSLGPLELGLRPTLEGDALYVLRAAGHAQAAGLKLGDIITAVAAAAEESCAEALPCELSVYSQKHSFYLGPKCGGEYGPEEFLVRKPPIEWESWQMNVEWGQVNSGDLASYLHSFGYMKSPDGDSWAASESPASNDCSWPQLTLGEIDGHHEDAGHTWYRILCHLRVVGCSGSATRHWCVERRLCHLQEFLHMPLKQSTRVNYAACFGSTHFASRGGLPGTTDKLRGWLTALAHAINEGKVTPLLVGRILRFLEAPAVVDFKGRPLPAANAPKEVAARMQSAVDAADDPTLSFWISAGSRKSASEPEEPEPEVIGVSATAEMTSAAEQCTNDAAEDDECQHDMAAAEESWVPEEMMAAEDDLAAERHGVWETEEVVAAEDYPTITEATPNKGRPVADGTTLGDLVCHDSIGSCQEVRGCQKTKRHQRSMNSSSTRFFPVFVDDVLLLTFR
eukprot:TRINITY_DN30843_c0_g1_i1.p1 TRINITY_DN30843_c0_g1~~TRINITY_DN30843_c0_g1_i1.p1  ORF type:complete len:520 (-),score=75.24 TRINITY_DN30843_c0_g1_i1:412-1944(-)